ncbi:hypothetical protein KDA_07410 [Dictyobacter alpinus]|uniref:Uncharacterized protein n=1 Tax=Dictyobacter alpinus TaxID=2014873 RepID=A0A402B1T0_9CHLR|nr:hypothetical protein [Dictyobacter alpinus]GCE25257.1 hypothetical protein KDA_07410 [Dictyobacter alpinus]
MRELMIHIEHLSRFFGTVKALDDLSLEVPAGIVFGFLGQMGLELRGQSKMEPLVSLLVQAGAKIEEVRPQSPCPGPFSVTSN